MTTAPAPPPYAPPPAYYPRRRGLNPWLLRLPILMVSGTLLLVLVLTLFLMAFQMRYIDRIVPGVYVLGRDLSGMTAAEASAALAPAFTYDRDTVFTFRYGDQFWQLTAGDLGVSLDVEATVQAAMEVGHSGDFFRNVLGQASAWFGGRSVAPIVEYDQNRALAELEAIAASINRPAVNATLTMQGTTVTASGGQTGRALDIPAALLALETVLTTLGSGGEIYLIVNESPPLVWNAEHTAALARTALSGPITLVATDQNGLPLGPWSASAAQIAALLNITLVDNEDGTFSYDLSVDTAAFSSFLEALAPGLITPAVDGRFEFDPSTGTLQVITPSVSGRELDIEETMQRLEAAIFSADNRVVPMAFTFVLPRYHNQITAEELGIRELVSESTTYFTGSSSNRRTNIAVSANRFHGIIIGPGEEFSFNHFLGELSYETGFVDDKLIFGGRTVDGLGGGACQTSTTVFRAAWAGGFPIIERNSHGYRVGYYEQAGQPPGLDAAIWTPERDFRFLNNTPYHLLIEVSIFPGNNALQFRFYSTRHWNTEIEAPIVRDIVPAPPPRFVANSSLQTGQSLQVDYAADGADVTVYRNIYDLQGNLVNRDYLYTHYLPWQAIYEVPPGDPRLSQES